MSNFVTVTSHKRKRTAAILCLIGGIFGAHQFYVGKIGTGFLYCFSAGGFLKCYWCDLGKILMGKFKDCHGTCLIE